MQLPSGDALIMVSGLPPIRARKLRYYQDRNFLTRLSPAPNLELEAGRGPGRSHDWQEDLPQRPPTMVRTAPRSGAHDSDAVPLTTPGVPPGDFFNFVTALDEAEQIAGAGPGSSQNEERR